METKMKPQIQTKLIISLLFAFGLTGCAGTQVKSSEDLLSAAGFDMQLADSDAKLAHLKTLQQHKIITHNQDGKIRYFYADATNCKCLYAGDEDSYKQYKKITAEHELAQQNEMAAEMNQDAFMGMGMWGFGW
jgi:hypothetical protein